MRYLMMVASVWMMISGAFAAPMIVQEGNPNAEIVITQDPPRSVKIAAWELQTYLRKISGALVPIVQQPGEAEVKLYVGQSPHTDALGISNEGLEAGAYRLVSGDNWLVMIGIDTDFQPVEPYTRNRSQRSSPEFIAAWDEITAPHKWGVPTSNAFKTIMNNAQNEFRDPSLPADDAERVDLWTFDERGSFNAVCGYLRHLGVRWFMPGELGEVVPKQASIPLPELDETAVPAFPVRDNSIAIGVHDRSLSVWGMRLGMRQPHGFGWAHGLNGVTARDEMKEAHPEYYALFAGERATGFRSGGKQCLSAPGLIDETVKYAQVLFDHFDHDVISLQPADGYTSLCQCELCEGKDSPERPHVGRLSNYVWGFTLKVAEEIAKTHPDRMVQNMAYNLARLPPEGVDKLPDNVLVCMIGARRPAVVDPQVREEIRELREAWDKVTDQPMVNFENYPLTARGHWMPNFTARTNAASINAIKGSFLGENIQPSSHRFMDAAAFNSYQMYFTYRMYWGDENQDVEPMLEEFYSMFYGPARDKIKEFYEYCEVHHPKMRTSKEAADRALTLFAEARAMVEEGSVYDQRLAVLGEYLEALKARSEQIAKEQERDNVPVMRMWRGVDITLDGKLDDPYWQEKVPSWAKGSLKEIETGRQPVYGTTFQVAWGNNDIYFAVRCKKDPDTELKIGTDRNDDLAMWYGEVLEILLETEQNAYYQIAISPSGAVVDLNREGRQMMFEWDSQAEVKTHIGENEWTAEIRIPVIADSNDPFHQVIGRQPMQSLPWYFNVCRQRMTEDGSELTAFSPTGERKFHAPHRFAKLYYR